MGKGSGGTRGSSWRDKFNIDPHDNINKIQEQIYNHELGDKILNSSPKVISDNDYNKFLNSGDYIEVYRGSEEGSHIKQMLNGKFHYDAENESGSGYYFSSDESETSIYTSSRNPNIIKALIKKTDLYNSRNISRETHRQELNRVFGEKRATEIIENGANGIRQFYPSGLIAAKQGKVLNSHGDRFMVIDRSKLIISSSTKNKYS